MSRRRGNDLKRFSTRSLSTQTRGLGFIQRITGYTKTDQSEQIEVWGNTTVDPHYMSIEPFSPKQIDDYRSINVEADHLVKIRGEIDIIEKDRILTPEEKEGEVVIKAKRIFEVKTVRNIQDRGIVKHVVCKEYRD